MDKEAALEFARQSLRRSRDWIEPNAHWKALKILIAGGLTNESPFFRSENIKSRLEQARTGDSTAEFVLRTVVAELIKRGDPLPPLAREWARGQ
jgi:hypothetical protein